MEPQDLIKYFAETKARVNQHDFYETHQGFVSKYGVIDVNTKELVKIKEIDHRLNKLDYRLVKNLNKLMKQ